MANMSYCRFENTSRDFADCVNALDEMYSNDESLSTLSDYERNSAERMYEMCKEYIDLYEQVSEIEDEEDKEDEEY